MVRLHVGWWPPMVYSDSRITVRGVARARERLVRSVKWLLWLTSGPQFHFVFSKNFNHPNFDIRIGYLSDAQNSPNFAGR
jgi:hypothetical protein